MSKIARPFRAAIGIASIAAFVLMTVHTADAAGFVKTGVEGAPDRITFTNLASTVPGAIAPVEGNPLIFGNNIWGPTLLFDTDRWIGFYGGRQGNLGQPYLIARAESASDSIQSAWTLSPAIQPGGFDRIYDPTVVRDGGQWTMLFTALTDDGNGTPTEWLGLATSADGVTWSPSPATTDTLISIVDPLSVAPGAVTDTRKAALLRNGADWRLWLDCQTSPDAAVHSYYADATAAEFPQFTLRHRFDDIDGYPGFSDPDVRMRADGSLLACVERHRNELLFATSEDGIDWSFVPRAALRGDDPSALSGYLVSPGLVYRESTDTLVGLAFAARFSEPLANLRIGFGYPQVPVRLREVSAGGPLVGIGRATDPDTLEFEPSDIDLVRYAHAYDPQTGEQLVRVPFGDAALGDVWALDLSNAAGRWAIYD